MAINNHIIMYQIKIYVSNKTNIYKWHAKNHQWMIIVRKRKKKLVIFWQDIKYYTVEFDA